MTFRLIAALLLVFGVLRPGPVAVAAGSSQTAPPNAGNDLKTRIASLGSLDFPTRMNAGRQIRRAPGAEAVPALTAAVRSSADEFVRYRALVLLTSFNDRSTGALVRDMLRDRNDRLREVGYKWLEENPDPTMTPVLLAALQSEQAEFVRPALIGALAALGTEPLVQRALSAEVGRGLDFFRSGVIDALGRHRATYAVDALVAQSALDGPLQDDVVVALGRIGGPRAQQVVNGMSATSPEMIAAVRAAKCLLSKTCEAEIDALSTAATSPGAAARAAILGLTTAADADHDRVMAALLNVASKAPAMRGDVAVALGTIAVRHRKQTIAWLVAAPSDRRSSAIDSLHDGFESLEEDFGEEQFFAEARAAYWTAAEGSPARATIAAVIDKLEF